MPPTQVAQIGVPLTMLQNIVYAVPVRSTLVAVGPETAVIEGSIDIAFTDPIPYVQDPLLSGQFRTGLPFIRCTDAAGCTAVFRV